MLRHYKKKTRAPRVLLDALLWRLGLSPSFAQVKRWALHDADFVEQLREARIGAQRIGHWLGTEVD